MTVLQLNTNRSGGSYEYAALLSRSLAAEGIDSREYSRDHAPVRTGRSLANRIVRRLSTSLSSQPWHGSWRILPPPDEASLAGVDIVHLHTVGDWFDVPKWLAALSPEIAVVISLHDLWHVSGGCFLYQGCGKFEASCAPCPILTPPANHLLARHELFRKTSVYARRDVRLIANSHWLAEMAGRSAVARECGGVAVIPPGIDTEIFRPQNREFRRQELGVSPGTFVIVTGCASLTDESKNTPWLLRQLAQLADLSSILVVAFGDGQIEVPDNLNVRFVGAIRDRRKLAALFGAADVFVSASRMETYGLALVEALACGIPVVASRVGGVPEAAPDGQVGILCEQQDDEAFRTAVQLLRNAPDLRRAMGASGAALVSARNAPTAFARSYAQLYRDRVAAARLPGSPRIRGPQ